MTITIRPVQLPADYPRIAQLLSHLKPEPVTAAELAQEDTRIPTADITRYDAAGRLSGFNRVRVLAEDADGQVIGYAASWRAPWAQPGTLGSFLVVDPAQRGSGTGGLLLAHLEEWARNLRATTLMSVLPDHLPASRRFVANRGYRIDTHVFESTLDLATFAGAPFAGVVEAVAATGLRFFTLADEPGEETLRRLYDLTSTTMKDIPDILGDAPNYEYWREELLQATKPDQMLLAADGDRLVGLCQLIQLPAPQATSGGMYCEYTAVDPTYRGRRLALALKMQSIDVARRYGSPYMRTSNNSKNAPMLAINRKLGFVQEPGQYRVVKDL